MAADRHARIKAIFSAAVELPPGEHPDFLRVQCGGDTELMRMVSELLAADAEAASGILDQTLVARGVIDGAPTVEAGADSRPRAFPARVGKYRLLRKIGEGGMGSVFEAEQDQPRRRVALKIIRSDIASPASIRRFEREAELLGQLEHPGLARIYDAGTHVLGEGAAVPFFAMELVQGEVLNDYLRRVSPPLHDRLEIVAKVCDAVQHAHLRGVIHRDLKPGNILVVEEAASAGSLDGVKGEGRPAAPCATPKVLDFGVARIMETDGSTTVRTAAGQIVGTLGYMSPEQVSGQSDQIDRRSDVYALGVILYECVADRAPYDIRGRTLPEIARIIREDEPTRLGFLDHRFRGDIETIVAKALEKDPQRRYSTAAELAADLRRYLVDEPIHARPISTFYQLRKFARRNRGLVSGLAIAAASLLLGAVISGWLALSENRQRVLAEEMTRKASEQAELAQAREMQARRLAYRSSIAGASAALQAGDASNARARLAGAPEDLRGWEWRHYNYLADRSLHLLEDHSGLITVSAAGGDSLMTADSRPMIRIWDLRSGALRREVATPVASRYASLRPDGRGLLWSDGETQTILFDVDAGTVRWTQPFGLRITPDAFDVDGARFVGQRTDGDLIALFDADSGEMLHPFTGITPALAGASFSPDGRRLLAHYDDARIQVADVQTGSVVWRANSWNCSFTPVPGMFCYFDGNIGEICFVDLDSGQVVRSYAVGADTPETWAFRPDGSDLAIAKASGCIELLNANTLTQRARVLAYPGTCAIRYSRDGQFLISAAADGAVRIWDASVVSAPTLVEPPRFELSYGGAVSPDGRSIARAGWGCVSMWDTESTALRWRMFVSRSFLRAVAFRPDGGQLAVSGQGGRVVLLEAHTGRQAGVVEVENCKLVLALAWSADGRSLLAALDTGEVRAIDLSTGSQVLFGRHDSPATCCALSADGALLASGSGNGLPGGDFGALAAPVNDCSVRIWDVAQGRERLRLAAHEDAVACVAFDKEGARLVSGSVDQTAAVWDVRSGERLLALRDAGAPLQGIAFTPDGSRVVGATEGNLRIWSSSTGELLASLPCGAKSGVNVVGFSETDDTLLIGGVRIAVGVFACRPPQHGETSRALTWRARQVVDGQHTPFDFASDAIAAIERDADIPAEVADEAVEYLRRAGDPVTRFISDAYGMTFRAEASNEYPLALRKVQSAMEVMPGDWRLLSILGLLQFRAGQAEARETLARAEAAYVAHKEAPPPQVEIAIAMLDYRDGTVDGARARFDKLRARLAGDPGLLDSRYSSLIAEAAELLAQP